MCCLWRRFGTWLPPKNAFLSGCVSRQSMALSSHCSFANLWESQEKTGYSRMTLWSHQQQAVEFVRKNTIYGSGRSLICMPPGSGQRGSSHAFMLSATKRSRPYARLYACSIKHRNNYLKILSGNSRKLQGSEMTRQSIISQKTWCVLHFSSFFDLRTSLHIVSSCFCDLPRVCVRLSSQPENNYFSFKINN